MLAAIEWFTVHMAGEETSALCQIGSIPDKMIDPHGIHMKLDRNGSPAVFVFQIRGVPGVVHASLSLTKGISGTLALRPVG